MTGTLNQLAVGAISAESTSTMGVVSPVPVFMPTVGNVKAPGRAVILVRPIDHCMIKKIMASSFYPPDNIPMAPRSQSKKPPILPVMARSRVFGGDRVRRGYAIVLPAKHAGTFDWDFDTPYTTEVLDEKLVIRRAKKKDPGALTIKMTSADVSLFFEIPDADVNALLWGTDTTVVMEILPEAIVLYKPSGRLILMNNIVETWECLFATRDLPYDQRYDYLADATDTVVNTQKLYRWRSAASSVPGDIVALMTWEVLEAVLKTGPITSADSELLRRALSIPKPAER